MFDTLRDLINVGGTIVSEPIKYILYLLNKWLFAIYRQLRDVLVLAAYAAPFTEELAINMGGPFRTSSLWQSMGNLASDQYPKEEILAERAFVDSSYAPFRPPSMQPGTPVEQPPVDPAAPYRPHGDPDTGVTPALPDDFIDAPLGPDDMFTDAGLEPPALSTDQNAPHTFASAPRNFGGVLANCVRAIMLAEQNFPSLTLPDYNLDCDRGYAWPCWDVDPEPTKDTNGQVQASDPLDPANRNNAGTAHVNAVRVTE